MKNTRYWVPPLVGTSVLLTGVLWVGLHRLSTAGEAYSAGGQQRFRSSSYESTAQSSNGSDRLQRNTAGSLEGLDAQTSGRAQGSPWEGTATAPFDETAGGGANGGPDTVNSPAGSSSGGFGNDNLHQGDAGFVGSGATGLAAVSGGQSGVIGAGLASVGSGLSGGKQGDSGNGSATGPNSGGSNAGPGSGTSGSAGGTGRGNSGGSAGASSGGSEGGIGSGPLAAGGNLGGGSSSGGGAGYGISSSSTLSHPASSDPSFYHSKFDIPAGSLSNGSLLSPRGASLGTCL
jgi:hypothetical protein